MFTSLSHRPCFRFAASLVTNMVGFKRNQPDGQARRLVNGQIIRQGRNAISEDQLGKLAEWVVSHKSRPKTSATMRWIRTEFDVRMEVDMCEKLVDALVEQAVLAHYQVRSSYCFIPIVSSNSCLS